ncbi:MAG: hypothetical protein QG564_742 [Campylobacterota bacterium]|nr:hypothetical protein [Campylobacterota bacterium]
MDINFIELKMNEIIAELEKEVMQILGNEKLDRKQTNLRMKPLVSTKKILNNAIDSIRMVEKLAQEETEKQ